MQFLSRYEVNSTSKIISSQPRHSHCYLMSECFVLGALWNKEDHCFMANSQPPLTCVNLASEKRLRTSKTLWVTFQTSAWSFNAVKRSINVFPGSSCRRCHNDIKQMENCKNEANPLNSTRRDATVLIFIASFVAEPLSPVLSLPRALLRILPLNNAVLKYVWRCSSRDNSLVFCKKDLWTTLDFGEGGFGKFYVVGKIVLLFLSLCCCLTVWWRVLCVS